MLRTGFLHLHTDEVSLLIDARGPQPPSVLHWGAPLGELDDTTCAALADAAGRPLAHNTPDVAVPLGLLPDAAAGYPGRPGLRGHRDGTAWTASFTLTGMSSGDHGATFECVSERDGLSLRTELELVSGGLLRIRHILRNDAPDPYIVDGLEVAIPVPGRASELLDFTGRHCRERAPQRHPFGFGSWLRENRRGRTGHDATLGMFAGTPGFGFRHGEVWAAHIAWSGNHVGYAERVVDGRAVLGGGELLLPGEIVLDGGQSYATPWFYAAYSDRGLDGVSDAVHGWLRSRPGHPGAPRPVVLNTWEAVYFDHDLDRLRGLADAAAAVGVERFVLDDGWFRHRRDDTAGLGDWYVDEDVWPHGLHPLIEHVRAAGMQFGLWVEPEMINPDSDLFRAHPDWVLAPAPGVLPPPARHQQVLDLANRGAYKYILARIDALLSEYPIDYLKWDHNRDLVAAGHDGRPGVHAQTRAIYRLLDELRARHPGLEIESCSSGGGRIDLEILQRTDRVWPSDCNDALERHAIQRWTGLFLPPELLGTHVGPPRSHTTGRTQDLGFRVATALFGHFGVEWDIGSASEEERTALSSAIAYYKEVRPLLHTGRVVRVDHPDPAGAVHGVVAADGSDALFCYTQLATSTAATPEAVRMPGLDDGRTYRVRIAEPAGAARAVRRQLPPWCAAGEIVLPGRVLGELGVRVPILEPEQAVLLRVTAMPG